MYMYMDPFFPLDQFQLNRQRPNAEIETAKKKANEKNETECVENFPRRITKTKSCCFG